MNDSVSCAVLLHRTAAFRRGLLALGLWAAALLPAAGLAAYGIDHAVEICDPGTHVGRIDARVETHVLPFFSDRLAFSG